MLFKIMAAQNNNGNGDDLFVLGRNIYQAACGGARAAIKFISDYQDEVAGISRSKAKNILDGMLFEVFFDKNGELRNEFKVSRFKDIFSLQRISVLSRSFEFISEVLRPYQYRFYVVPGIRRNVSIDVLSSANSTLEHVITEVHFEGCNILKTDDNTTFSSWGPYPIKYDTFIETISTGMVVPLSQLKVNTDFDHRTVNILWPFGATLGK